MKHIETVKMSIRPRLWISNLQKNIFVDLPRLKSHTTRLMSAADISHLSLTVTVISNAHMRRVHRLHRKVPRTASVLACESDGLTDLGDIWISAGIAQQRATTVSCDVDSMIFRHVLHGVLHLNGHTHDNDVDFGRMSHEERTLLAQLRHEHPSIARDFGEYEPEDDSDKEWPLEK